MGAISDLAKSGLNTNRAYHIRICLDSCGFLHDERCLYVELINNVFCLARAEGKRRGPTAIEPAVVSASLDFVFLDGSVHLLTIN